MELKFGTFVFISWTILSSCGGSSSGVHLIKLTVLVIISKVMTHTIFDPETQLSYLGGHDI